MQRRIQPLIETLRDLQFFHSLKFSMTKPLSKPLSKSKLIAYRQCPKRLWLEIHRPDLREDSSATQAVFASGHKVGELALSIFDPAGTGYLIDMQVLGMAGAFAKTADLVVATDAKPIFEAGFTADVAGNSGALAFSDVLLPDTALDKAWHMIEVKSSTSVKDYHLDDAAIQSHVARHSLAACGQTLASVSMALIDNQWVYQGDGNYQGLLKTADVTAQSLARDAEVQSWIAEAQSISRKAAAPVRATGEHCKTPFPCGFRGHCSVEDGTADLKTEFPIQWLPRISQAKINAVFAKKKGQTNDVDARGLSMMDMPDEHLSAVQKRIKAAHKTGTAFVDAASIKRELAPHQPSKGRAAYFLDFETTMQAVPIWAGTRPYQTILYQFSCHVVRSDGSVEHTEFLDTSGGDPRPAIAAALVKALGEPSRGNNSSGNKAETYSANDGTIFMYSPFERTQLKSLADAVPQHRAALERIMARLVDLLPTVRDNYYHPAQEGSWSIKSVLPAMFGTNDPELSYESLGVAGKVANGGDAQAAYLEAIDPTTSPERKAAIHAELLAYCKLDTLAMVRVWEHLTKIIKS
jgi:Domain of unknown function(DUF2779)